MVEHPQPILGFSNSAIYKTSDQANSIKWLRYMFVYAKDNLLHFGRAIPREWLREGNRPYAEGVVTRFGLASVQYYSQVATCRISAQVDIPGRTGPSSALLRFRHPDELSIKAVTVNGASHALFDAEKGDVDITGFSGSIEVVAEY